VALSLLLISTAMALVLAHAPTVLSRTNRALPTADLVTSATGPTRFCQAGEYLPAGTTAIRPWLAANSGPRVRLEAISGTRAIAAGETGSGWTSRELTVSVAPLKHAVSDVTICVSFQVRDEEVEFVGFPSPLSSAAVSNGRPLPGRLAIEYLRPGSRSWTSQLLEIARRIQFGRSLTGHWIVGLLLALTAGLVALVSVALIGELR
jgi:hypothetical protein